MNYRDYEKFFNACPIPCIYGEAIKDIDGVLIDFIIKGNNDNMYKLLQVDNEKIINKSIKEIIPGIIEEKLYCEKKDVNMYIDTLNGNFKIDIIYLENNKYMLCFDKNKDISICNENYDGEFEKVKLETFANLSHELRTPLNLIFSSLQVLDKGYNITNKKTDKTDNRHLPIIRQNGYRLLKLVDNIIDVSKISFGSIDYCPKNYDIVSFIENICESVSDFAKQNSMEIIFDTDIEEKVIGFDLDKMERIMLNLLSNALKFNKKNGKIEISITNYDEVVKISVKDNGIGIPDNELCYVFDRFKQVKNKQVKTNVGSGIGLSLVKSLVDVHKGNIYVNSILGKGTEFIVEIPDIVYDISLDEVNNKTLKDKFVQTIEVEFSDIYI